MTSRRFSTRAGEYLLTATLVMAWMGGIGFLDDYLKLKQKREGRKNEGLVERDGVIGARDWPGLKARLDPLLDELGA